MSERLSPQELEFVMLTSEIVVCVRNGMFFAAGLWLKEAVTAKDRIADKRKQKLATSLLSGLYDAVEIAEKRQEGRVRELQELVSSVLSGVRPGGATSPGVQLGHPPGE